jgi:prevent-host-death family protein
MRPKVKLKLNISSAWKRRRAAMETIINAKTLRNELRAVIERVARGERFTVLYRSRPVCRLIPVDSDEPATGRPEDDSLYQAEPVGASQDGLSATDHDVVLYLAGAKKKGGSAERMTD